jgi:hypothetical protein
MMIMVTATATAALTLGWIHLRSFVRVLSVNLSIIWYHPLNRWTFSKAWHQRLSLKVIRKFDFPSPPSITMRGLHEARNGSCRPSTARFLNLCTGGKWVISLTARPLYPRGKSPRYPLLMRLSGIRNWCGPRGEITILDPTGTRTQTTRPSSPYPDAVLWLLFSTAVFSI